MSDTEVVLGASRFLEKNSVGAVLRGFAPRPEDVPSRVEQLIKAARLLTGLTPLRGKRPVSRVHIWIAADTTRKDHDCGLLKDALMEAKRAARLKDVFVSEIDCGDIFVGLLNRAVFENPCTHTLILSSEASSFLNDRTMAALLRAHTIGARVSGLAFDDLSSVVLRGHLMNTCALWDNASLSTAAGFDPMCEQLQADHPDTSHVEGWGVQGGVGTKYLYNKAGVEEVPTIIQMIRLYLKKYGPFIAPIRAEDGTWVRPDQSNREAWARFEAKLATKVRRMRGWARMKHVELDYVWQAVMPDYRDPEWFGKPL